MAADQLGIDGSKQFAVEQRAMLLAPREIDAISLAERIEAARRARMFPPRHRQRIDDTLKSDARLGNAFEFGVEESHVE